MTNFQALLKFMGEHPFLSFLLAWMLFWLLAMPFRLLNRYFRSRNIKNAGWPPKHLDADGDVIEREKA